MNFLPDQTDSSFVLASFLPWGFSAVVRSVIISKQYLVADKGIIIPDIENDKSVTKIFHILVDFLPLCYTFHRKKIRF